MQNKTKIKWQEFLSHEDPKSIKKFVLSDTKQVRISEERIVRGLRVKYVQFNNGATTKWHYHTKNQQLRWVEGVGVVEMKDNEGYITKLELSEKNKIIDISPFVIHRHGGVEDSAEFIHLAKNSGETIWLEDNRHYKTTSEETFKKTSDPDITSKLSTIYSEVNANYRHLADIRFKLLALVPASSVLLWVGLFKAIAPHSILQNLMGFLISYLALKVTYGIIIYDKRNNELYDDLISRGRKIEDQMGAATAIFKGRKKAVNFIAFSNSFKYRINHDTGLGLIYSSVKNGWYLIIAYFIFKLIYLIILNYLI